MTGEEMERAIVFILEQQAQTTTRLDSLVETVGTLSRTVETLTGTVETLSRSVERNAGSIGALLAIAEIHEREITEQHEAQLQTDERLNALIETVERYITEGRNGKRKK